MFSPNGIDELRERSTNWSLEGDSKILELMSSISKMVESRGNQTQQNLSKMILEVDSSNVELANTANKLLALQNSQYVENRVYEDDETTAIDTTVATEKKNEQQAVSAKELISAIRVNTKRMIDNCYEKVILDLSDSEDENTGTNQFSNMLYRPKDPYQNKPLPYMIGSKEWKEKWHVGLLDSDEEASDEEPKEEFSDSSDLDDQLSASISLPSTGPTLSESEQSWKPTEGYLPHTIDISTVRTDPQPKPRPSISNSSENQSSIPPPQIKRQVVNLFNENMSDSYSDSAEKDDTTIQPDANQTNFFRQQRIPVPLFGANIISDEPPQLPAVPKERKPMNLFWDSDDDEDQITTNKESVPNDIQSNISSKAVSSNIGVNKSQSNVKIEPVKKQREFVNLFANGSESDDEPLKDSAPEPSEKNINTVSDSKEKSKLPSLFDDEPPVDLFENIVKESKSRAKSKTLDLFKDTSNIFEDREPSPVAINKQNPKKVSLFADSDESNSDSNDLFASSKSTRGIDKLISQNIVNINDKVKAINSGNKSEEHLQTAIVGESVIKKVKGLFDDSDSDLENMNDLKKVDIVKHETKANDNKHENKIREEDKIEASINSEPASSKKMIYKGLFDDSDNESDFLDQILNKNEGNIKKTSDEVKENLGIEKKLEEKTKDEVDKSLFANNTSGLFDNENGMTVGNMIHNDTKTDKDSINQSQIENSPSKATIVKELIKDFYSNNDLNKEAVEYIVPLAIPDPAPKLQTSFVNLDAIGNDEPPVDIFPSTSKLNTDELLASALPDSIIPEDNLAVGSKIGSLLNQASVDLNDDSINEIIFPEKQTALDQQDRTENKSTDMFNSVGLFDETPPDDDWFDNDLKNNMSDDDYGDTYSVKTDKPPNQGFYFLESDLPPDDEIPSVIDNNESLVTSIGDGAGDIAISEKQTTDIEFSKEGITISTALPKDIPSEKPKSVKHPIAPPDWLQELKTETPSKGAVGKLVLEINKGKDLNDKTVDLEKPSTSKPKKLTHNLNINVGALLPGAKRPSSVVSASVKDTDNKIDEKFESHSEEKIEKEEESNVVAVKDLPALNPDGTLTNLTKNRAKILVKRRPSTRQGRKESYVKSLIIDNDENPVETVSEVYENTSETVIKSITTETQLKKVEEDKSKNIAITNQNSSVEKQPLPKTSNLFSDSDEDEDDFFEKLTKSTASQSNQIARPLKVAVKTQQVPLFNDSPPSMNETKVIKKLPLETKINKSLFSSDEDDDFLLNVGAKKAEPKKSLNVSKSGGLFGTPVASDDDDLFSPKPSKGKKPLSSVEPKPVEKRVLKSSKVESGDPLADLLK